MNGRISQSRIKTMRRCPKKHDYKHNQRLESKKPAATLFRGTILHEMIEANTKRKSPFAVTRNYAKEYRNLFREEREMYGETFIQDIDRIFEGYQRSTADDKLRYEYIEEQGVVELPNGIEFSFKVDKIATDGTRRWLMDHKSCRSIPDENTRFSDLQLVLYYWAWNELHPDEKVDGVIWDYLKTKPPTVPEPLKRGGLSIAQNMDTDYHTYVMAAATHKVNLNDPHYKEYVANLKKRGSMDFFQRISLPAPPKPLVKSIVEDAAETAALIERQGEKMTTRHMTKDCSWDCDFYKLCHAEIRGLDADFVRKTEFQVGDPDERYSKESE